MKRRSFLQRLASTGIVLPFAMGFPRVRVFAQSPAGSPFMRLAGAENDHVMIMIRLAGGNDGVNTVIPYSSDTYYTARKRGSADDLSIPVDSVIKLSDSSTMGLHPGLAPLATLYEERKMAIVQNVGYPNQNLSHFRSTDIWLSGSDWNVYDDAGWYGKYLEAKYPDYPGVLPADPFAIELGTYLSTTLIGEQNNMGIAVADLSYVPGQPDPDPVAATHAGEEEAYVKEIARQSNIFSNSIIAAGLRQTTNKVTYPANNQLGQGLAAIARLIAAGLGTQMYILNVGGYDTHSNQLVQQGNLHTNFANAVSAFQRDLEAFGVAPRVTTMTVSEFGRRLVSNGTGTDHGSAAPMFVIGSGVNGGIIGNNPDLENLEGQGNIRMEHDFRQVYASVLGQWFGASEDEISSRALPRHFEQLPIFRPGVTGVTASSAAAAAMNLGQNYPNPASAATVIPLAGIPVTDVAHLSLYSIDGRELLTRTVMPGQTSLELDTRALPNGTYIYELKSGSVKKRKTMVVAR